MFLKSLKSLWSVLSKLCYKGMNYFSNTYPFVGILYSAAIFFTRMKHFCSRPKRRFD